MLFQPRRDVFSPILLSGPSRDVPFERLQYLREVLLVCCSDSKFAEKAAGAIVRIITGPASVIPTVTSLTPSTAALGSPSFTLHVHGTSFDSMSQIVWNGSVEPTIYVSATELTTLVDMSTAQVAISIPVAVQGGNGALSNTMTFNLTAAAAVMAASVPGKK